VEEKYEVLKKIKVFCNCDDESVVVSDFLNILSEIKEFLLEGLELQLVMDKSMNMIEVRKVINKAD